MVAFMAMNFRSPLAGRSCSYFVNKKLQESFNRFVLLFDEAERIRRVNITSSTKQLDWFSVNQRRYAWVGIKKLKLGAAASTGSIQKERMMTKTTPRTF